MRSTKLERVFRDASFRDASMNRSPARRWGGRVVVGLIGFACGLAVPAPKEPPEAGASATDAVERESERSVSRAPIAQRRPRPIERPFLMRPVEPQDVVEPEEQERYRVQQAKEMLDLLRAQVARAEKIHGYAGPEAVVNGLGPYLLGWTDIVVRAAPDLAEELAGEMEKTLCDASTGAAHTMIVTRVMQRMPELGSTSGFDCVMRRGKEDIVLWEALDAWRLSTLPKTPALEQLANTSKDERTLRRLVKQADEVVQRPDMIPESQREGPIEYSPPHAPDLALALKHAESQELRGSALEQLADGPPGAGPKGVTDSPPASP